MCSGGVESFSASLLPALGDGVFAPSRVCSEFFIFCEASKLHPLKLEDFTSAKLIEKEMAPNTFQDMLYEVIAKDTQPRKVRRSIQISDPHIDFYYKAGTPNKSNYPISCRDNGSDMIPTSDSSAAGEWGDY